jgi:pyruvate-ferredoxin/flavodoxin oxidoreductase
MTGPRNGRKNVFGNTMTVREMQSEAGAAAAVHGSLAAGALTSTFTASQGLLLMIPNMYKMSGELLPAVIHVTARSRGHPRPVDLWGSPGCHGRAPDRFRHCWPPTQRPGSHGHGRWSPILPPSNPAVPFLHFFDGFRTSHEIQKIEMTSTMRTWPNWFITARPWLGLPGPRAPTPNGRNCAAPPRTRTSISRAAEACNPYYLKTPASWPTT